MSYYENAERNPNRATLIGWAFATGVSLAWLETGADPTSGGPDQGGAVTREKVAETARRVVTLVSAA